MVVLHYYLGLPLQDVAATLDLPVGTVKSRLHRSLSAMRIAITVDDLGTGSAAPGGAVRMTGSERVERQLQGILEDLAAPRRPDYLDDLHRQLAATRQRSAWTLLERWLPVTDYAVRSVPAPRLPLRAIGAVLLIAALAPRDPRRRRFAHDGSRRHSAWPATA